MGTDSVKTFRTLARLAALLSLFGLGALSCSRGEPVDLTRLRVFFTTDAIGYLEPCG